MTRYHPGDVVSARVTDRAGTTATTALTIRRVDRLGCGCTRLTCDRPGPGDQHSLVEVLDGRCHRHERDIQEADTR